MVFEWTMIGINAFCKTRCIHSDSRWTYFFETIIVIFALKNVLKPNQLFHSKLSESILCDGDIQLILFGYPFACSWHRQFCDFWSPGVINRIPCDPLNESRWVNKSFFYWKQLFCESDAKWEHANDWSRVWCSPAIA